MNYGGTILLTAILVILVGLLFLVLRGMSWSRQSRRESEREEEQRLFFKSIGDGQRTIVSSLISIQADLADLRNRISTLESGTGDGK